MSMASNRDCCARKMVTLKCRDGAVFELEEGMALESEAIKRAIAESGNSAAAAVELPEVDGDVLAVIIRYLELGKESSADKFAEELTHDPNMLFGVARGAYDLKIEPLVDLACTTVAGMMAGKSPEEIQKAFKIDPDYAEAQRKRAQEEFPFFFEDLNDPEPEPEKPRMSIEELRAAKKQQLYAMRKKSKRAATKDRVD